VRGSGAASVARLRDGKMAPREFEAAAAHLAMLVFAFLVSSSFTVGDAIADAIEPAALMFLRFLLAVMIFLAILLVRGPRLATPRPVDVARYGWLALLLVVFFVTMFEGLRLTSALNAGAVFTLVPPMTAIISLLVLGQRLSLGESVTLLVAGGAALWVLTGGRMAGLGGFSIGAGEAIYFFGCVSYAAYSPSVRLFRGSESLVELTFWTLVFALVLLALYGWRAILGTDWRSLPLLVYLGIAHLALFCTAISFYLIQFASTRLPSAKVMAYTYLIPAFVVVQKVVLGAPWPAWPVLAGVGVITSAMIVLQRGPARLRRGEEA